MARTHQRDSTEEGTVLERLSTIESTKKKDMQCDNASCNRNNSGIG